MNSRLALPVVVLGATVFVSPALAQMGRMGASAPPARTHFSSSRLGTRVGFSRMHHRRFFPRSVFLPFFFSDDDYDEYEPVAAQAPPPQVVVVEPAPPPAPAPKPIEPLVLENQGGQWVRISNYSQSSPRAQAAPPAPPPAAGLRSAPSGPKQAAPPPAVLVFRDGHQEEVKRYMIKGDAIFTGANYWSTGSWTRKVPVAELDLPATLKLNEERGGKFSLPSGPNEVIIRP